MKIIPVIDLKNGVVVHAKKGDRQHYQPIHSALCPSADIYRVIEAFLQRYNFDTFYIADLNAIAHQDNHDGLIGEVVAHFPQLRFWVDKGYQSYDPLIHPENYIPVLGSESYKDDTISELKSFASNFILSLDYSVDGALGASSLFACPDLWPENIIIMTLAQVGSNLGPDWDKLSAFCKRYPHKNFIAAGGIRHLADLQALQQLGIRQALIASSLHSGVIGPRDIANL